MLLLKQIFSAIVENTKEGEGFGTIHTVIFHVLAVIGKFERELITERARGRELAAKLDKEFEEQNRLS